MDTVHCVRDPTDPGETVDILKAHPKFTVELARTEMEQLSLLWDGHDQANNRDLVKFHLSSVDRCSEQIIRQDKLDEDDSFVVYWMIMVRAMHLVSFIHYTDIKDKIRVLEPAHFPGQNILQMALKLKLYCQELCDANQWEHHLVLFSL